jgi:dihydrofolate reductase
MDHDFTSDLRRTADTILAGRVVFESFAAAWPARAADRSGPPELVEFANWMLDTPKVVFSTGVTRASMKNSRIASRPIADEVAHLRDDAGGDMVVFGGARTVDAFVRLGLVDEFWLKVHPVAIGAGLPVFGGLAGPADFGLTWHKVYASGVVGVRYRRLSAGADMTRSRYVE